jgi:hypothetical protein
MKFVRRVVEEEPSLLSRIGTGVFARRLPSLFLLQL